MPAEKQQSMTASGLEKLQEELTVLKTVKRKEVIERVKASRCFGLIENSDYETAREDQAFIEGRILTLESLIRNAVIIEEDVQNNDTVSLGKTISFIEMPDGEEESYTIVGSAEADPIEGLISADSPIARNLIGCTVGEQVKVKTPDGEIYVKIVSIK
ncbi:transcription elongation factor GreA [Paenisporosarcina quisquiliarum]|uniref:Transcription elongation factor GreA n=1 Tax=Paenisporosarcina quisquiliarum TaxID=365346 RepID=A0A9X3LDN7_9BACL|nr:transcription elongation factor GreA [Paenisporosarcina quisquiliarum]MCZ8536107.1 transcription elongation factor GreA [Paenisporosarcina quisquiliarum]